MTGYDDLKTLAVVPDDGGETDETRERLLRAAGEVFAERGFDGATVRDICRRASANVAAVNYHFGDKARLYSETLRYWARRAMEKYPPNMGVAPDSPPEEKLYAYVRSFLGRVFDLERHAHYGRMIMREMVEPTHALDERIEETIRPQSELLLSIIREILGPGATEEQVRLAGCSITGQIVFYHNYRPLIEKVFTERPVVRDSRDVDALARHVTDFSLAALRETARRNASNVDGHTERPEGQ